MVDYDISSNWGNWQSVALSGRTFNPVKQAYDYDDKGEYVRAWVEEVKDLKDVSCVFQCWKLSDSEKSRAGLVDSEMVQRPLVKIEWHAGRGSESGRKGGKRDKGHGKGRGAKAQGWGQ